METRRIIGIAALLGTITVLVLLLLLLPSAPEDSGEEPGHDPYEQATGAPVDDDNEPVYPGGDPEPAAYERRPPTEREREEDLAEIRRMHEELPGNYWLPPLPGDEQSAPGEEQQKRFSENERLRRKVLNGSATSEEKQAYLRLRRKITEDRIAVIEYYMQRAEETPEQKWFPPEDIAAGQERIDELRAELAGLEEDLQ